MAYETGASTGSFDLLDKLRIFALAQGHTVDQWQVGANHRWLHLTLVGGQSVGLYRADNSEPTFIKMIGDTGYNAGNAWNAQPNASELVYTDVGNGAFLNYWFFGGTDYLYVAIEVTAGIFRHLCIGRLSKVGVYTGGEFITGTRWDQVGAPYINQVGGNADYSGNSVPFDGYSLGTSAQTTYPAAVCRVEDNGLVWASTRYYTSPQVAHGLWGGTRRGWHQTKFERSPNTFNLQSILYPIHLFLNYRNTSLYSPLGEAKDIRYIRLQNLTPAQEITLGVDVWKCFPMVTQQSSRQSNTYPNTWYYGLAYKKVV